jgi:type IV secretory pathway VirD2 relaxase
MLCFQLLLIFLIDTWTHSLILSMHAHQTAGPISERALFQRVDRKLRQDGRRLRRAREGTNTETSVGRYYAIDVRGNFVTDSHVDLEELARELEVLAGWESLETAAT